MAGAYRGEMGVELALVLPFAHLLHTCGRLGGSVSCGQLRDLYYFSDNHRELPFCTRVLPEALGPGGYVSYAPNFGESLLRYLKCY